MALTVSSLFTFSQTPFKLKLIAGKTGLSKTVSWIYYTEDPTTIEFIRGGELAITTCLNLERKKQNEEITTEETSAFLKQFIDSFLNNNASGLIINTGKYINEIPQSIIEYCNQKDFPLFTMPWEIHTVDLMQEFGNMITSDNQNSRNVEKFFYSAIFEQENFDPKQLENTIFHNVKSFSIALIELDESLFNNDMEQIKRYIHFSFNPKLNVPSSSYCNFIHNHKIIYIIMDDNISFAHELTAAVKSDRILNNMKLSLSDKCTDIKDLKSVYNHAEIAMELNNSDDALSLYDNMGIYKILLEISSKTVLEKFYQEILGNIEQLESAKREDYLKTLALYLKLGGNIHAVAEQNNTHRNTVLYRLQRVESVLNIDLDDGDTRCLLQIALYIRKLLKK